jgi:hypothetical protein
MNVPFRPARTLRHIALSWLIFGSCSFVSAQPKEPDLGPPHGEILPTFWDMHGWQLSLATPPVLILIGLSVWWVRHPRRIVPELPVAIARRSLESLRSRVPNDALAVEVSRVLRRYIWAVLGFSPGEMTTSEIRQTLQSHPQINPELAAALGEFLRRCDEWKFAPAPTPQPAIITDALALVEQVEMTRQHIPSPEMKGAVAS